MANFKAILFDVGGTLLDTSDFIFSSFEYSLKKHGFKVIEREVMSKFMGHALESCYMAFAPNGDIVTLCKSHREFQENNLHLSKPFPESKKVLKKLEQKGVKMGVVTSRAKNAIPTLKNAGLYKYLEIVVTAEDVKNVKPDPEALFKALSFIKVKPMEAIMVGDTEIDILAGKNAGTKTARVLYGLNPEKAKVYIPDYRLKALSDILSIV